MADRSLTEGENNFISELMHERNDEVRYFTWIRKVKRGKVDERVIIVSKYKVFTVKRTVTGAKQIRREGHLYELKKIHSTGPEQLLLTFVKFFIDVQSPKADEILKAIRESYMAITTSWTPESVFRLEVPQERLLPLEPFEPGIASGFLETYPAWCVHFGLPPSMPVVQYVKDRVARQSTIFDLSMIPGIDPLGPDGSFSIQPIFSTLRHNLYFTSVRLSGVTRPHSIQALADALAHNSTLVEIKMRSVGAKEGFVELGNAIATNRYCRVQHLDLSGNRITDKSAQGLGQVVGGVSLGLTVLNLAGCQISSKGFKFIFAGMEQNASMGKSLVELSIGENKLDNDGTNALSAWISSTRITGNALKRLDVRNCKANVTVLTNSLKNASCPQMEVLDISGSKFDKEAVANMSQLIANTNTISTLIMSGCKISKEGLECVIRALLLNTNLKETILDISEMNFGLSGMKILMNTLKGGSNLHTLNIGGNQLKSEGVVRLCDALLSCGTLKNLYLDSAVKAQQKGNAAAAAAVVKLLHENSSIEMLAIRGREDWYWGADIIPILKAVEQSQSLRELNINGSRGGDEALVALGDALKENRSLYRICIDSQNATLVGYQSIHYAMSVNKTLFSMVFPRRDFERLGQMYAPQPRILDRVRDTLRDIQSRLKVNFDEFERINPDKAHEYVPDVDETSPAAQAIESFRGAPADGAPDFDPNAQWDTSANDAPDFSGADFDTGAASSGYSVGYNGANGMGMGGMGGYKMPDTQINDALSALAGLDIAAEGGHPQFDQTQFAAQPQAYSHSSFPPPPAQPGYDDFGGGMPPPPPEDPGAGEWGVDPGHPAGAGYYQQQ